MEVAKLVLEYLKVVLAWPVVGLICFLLFVLLFKAAIRNLIDRIKKIYGVEVGQKEQKEALAPNEADDKIANSLEQGGVTLTTEQLQALEAEFNKLTETTNQQTEEIQNKDELIKYAIQRAELYEFAYLQRVLVANTQLALLWFYAQPMHSSTKENFMHSYKLPEQISDQEGEKEAMMNALIVYELIDSKVNPALFAVTQKGERFLKALKLISQ